MAACVLEWVPDSLYNSSISAIVANYSKFKKDIKILPENVQFDVYYKLYNKGRLCSLCQEFSELEVFSRVLRVTDKRLLLHTCFQAVMDHGQKVSETLSDAYCQLCCVNCASDIGKYEKTVQLGLSLGCFLSEAGWYSDAEKVLHASLQVCRLQDRTPYWIKALECCIRLLHVQNANCKYQEAEESWRTAQSFLTKLREAGQSVNTALLHSEYCALLFSQSLYDKAYEHCCLALQQVTPNVPPKAVVDVFRQCAKACVVKREFKRAELIIQYTVMYAREHFGVKHPKYSEALVDYGFYLLNVDYIAQAVQVYQAALDIRMAVFGGNNLHVAVAHEDLAYSTYVHEYSFGKFQNAKDHAETAINIITSILPKDHLCLASSKRVKALILEEIAIDNPDKAAEQRLLQDAQELHLSSLQLAMRAFGENNVQTAKHYGNLGRLYQSMQRFQEAEKMHIKAISIKERLLGPEDYEVALSVGHLASLYNYDMRKYEEAEKLYLRSINTGRKLFGPGYSGLEYDYRGLLRLYREKQDFDKVAQYGEILQEWGQIRDQNNTGDRKPLDDLDTEESVDQMLSRLQHMTH